MKIIPNDFAKALAINRRRLGGRNSSEIETITDSLGRVIQWRVASSGWFGHQG